MGLGSYFPFQVILSSDASVNLPLEFHIPGSNFKLSSYIFHILPRANVEMCIAAPTEATSKEKFFFFPVHIVSMARLTIHTILQSNTMINRPKVIIILLSADTENPIKKKKWLILL